MIRGSKARECWFRSYRNQLLSLYFSLLQSGEVEEASRIASKIETVDYISDVVLGIDLRPGDFPGRKGELHDV